MSSNTGENNDRDKLGGGSNGGEMTSNKKECASCEQNNVDNITEGIDSMAILNDTSICAACGKEGDSNDMNTCNKCKEVKYCNAACKKKHRHKHKKKCERRVAELHDEKLFKDVEPDECLLCMQPTPVETKYVSFHSCCGKLICNGCMYSMMMSEGQDICAFCRTPPAASDEEIVKRVKKLMDNGNANAFNMFGYAYAHGRYNMQRNWSKANESWLKAGELGCMDGYFNFAVHLGKGRGGIEVDEEKSKHYYELAAMGGHAMARYNLGCLEWKAGNYDRAYKHLILAARAGHKKSLDFIKEGFMDEEVSKDEYETTLRAYHERQKEMKSDMRDAAEEYRLMMSLE